MVIQSAAIYRDAPKSLTYRRSAFCACVKSPYCFYLKCSRKLHNKMSGRGGLKWSEDAELKSFYKRRVLNFSKKWAFLKKIFIFLRGPFEMGPWASAPTLLPSELLHCTMYMQLKFLLLRVPKLCFWANNNFRLCVIIDLLSLLA